MVDNPMATAVKSITDSREFFEKESEHWKALYQAERDRVNRLRQEIRDLWAIFATTPTNEEIEIGSRTMIPGDMSDNSSSETRHLTIPQIRGGKGGA
jgi:hypothetical protein